MDRDLAIDSGKSTNLTQIAFSQKSIIKNKQIRVAVIDSGIAPYVKEQLGCDTGHEDFTGTGLNDHYGHGTHVSGLIHLSSGRLSKEKYCQIYLKFYDPAIKTKGDLIANIVSALKVALRLKVDIVNISGGGKIFSQEERDAIIDLLNSGIIVVAAAGNEKSDISSNKGERYYPASYDSRIIVVGNRESLNEKAPSSNYGSNVVNWEKGVDAISFGLKKDSWVKMTGTSQATAIKSGKILREIIDSGSF
jgi:subtilisin family serine protease